MKSTHYVDSKKFEAALLHSGKAKQQIVAETGFSKQTINNMLREKYCRGNPFAMSTILAIAASCGCTATDLLRDDPEPEPEKECRLFDDLAESVFTSTPTPGAQFVLLSAIREVADGLINFHNALTKLWGQEEGKS